MEHNPDHADNHPARPPRAASSHEPEETLLQVPRSGTWQPRDDTGAWTVLARNVVHGDACSYAVIVASTVEFIQERQWDQHAASQPECRDLPAGDELVRVRS